MTRAILFLLLLFGAQICFSQDDTKLYVLKDTIITGVDTVNLIHTTLKVLPKLKRKFSFEATQGDTILYSLSKQKNTKMKYFVVKPNAEEKEYPLDADVKNVRLETDGGTGSYVLELKNRSFITTNHITIDLKQVHGWKRTEKIKKDPPKEDSVVVAINDTVPRIIIDATYYLGARKNIKAESNKLITFEYVADSVPCYWSYMVGFGKDFGTQANNLIDLETQQPVGDPLVAWFTRQYQDFPYSQSQRAKMSLDGPGVSKQFNTTDYGTYHGKRGVYELSVTNKDEVVGDYIYFKVVAFDFVKKGEIKVPMSEYKKMKIAKCSNR